MDLIDYIAQRAGQSMDKRIVLTGHSMGSALCAMTAYQLIHRYPALRHRIFIVQFGSPNYARKQFVRWLNTYLYKRVISIVLEGDSVPKSPLCPPFYGWYSPVPRVLICPAQRMEVDEFGNEIHFHYWQTLRQLLAFG